MADFGGCSVMASSTLTIGAPPNTSGITYTGRPPDLNAQMMHTAPAAPSPPPIVARMIPPMLNPDNPPCADRPTTGIRTPIRK